MDTLKDQLNYRVLIPELEKIEQGQEFFFIEAGGLKKKIGFHDYGKIYEIPGLYEHLFYDKYQCNSPKIVCGLLQEQMADNATGDIDLTVLDIGAGNGMVAEQLAQMGANTLIGIDIINEAAVAAQRDRPGLYEKYYVADLTSMSPEVQKKLDQYNFNCMTVVAALGFDDIPPAAFVHGFNLVSDSGWMAFNIKEDFVCDSDKSGFCRLIEHLDTEGILEMRARRRYRHRYCQDGTPLYYVAVVGQKKRDIPLELLDTITTSH